MASFPQVPYILAFLGLVSLPLNLVINLISKEIEIVLPQYLLRHLRKSKMLRQSQKLLGQMRCVMLIKAEDLVLSLELNLLNVTHFVLMCPKGGDVSSLAVNTSHPVSVISNVCSNYADLWPSQVLEVH